MNEALQNQTERSESAEIKVYDIDQAIERAGGFGLYQIAYTCMLALWYTPDNYIISNLAFLTLVPVLRWPTYEGDIVWKDHDINPWNGDSLK